MLRLERSRGEAAREGSAVRRRNTRNASGLRNFVRGTCYRAEPRRDPRLGQLRSKSCPARPRQTRGRSSQPMNRRFALIQALVSLIALAAVIWGGAPQEAPGPPRGGGGNAPPRGGAGGFAAP